MAYKLLICNNVVDSEYYKISLIILIGTARQNDKVARKPKRLAPFWQKVKGWSTLISETCLKF